MSVRDKEIQDGVEVDESKTESDVAIIVGIIVGILFALVSKYCSF